VVRSRLAPVPPIASVLPPGAGNEEPKKALKPDDERAKKTEERAVRKTGVVHGHLDTPAIRANRDGDVASIATIEQTQGGLQNVPGGPGRFAQSTRRLVFAQPRANGLTEFGLGPRRAGRQLALADPRAGYRGTIQRYEETVGRSDGLVAPACVLAARTSFHFQRCPASRTRAELASAESISTTRKA
jgi:hypothetical protein